MLNKLVNTSHKDEKRQGGVSWYIQRGRGKEFFLFAFTTVMFFTVVLWSNEPRFGTLSSAQQQFVLSSPASAGREYASKSLTVVSNVGGTKHLVDQQSSASAATTTTTTAAAAATERSLAAQKQENLESASSLDQKIYSEEKPKLLVTNNVQKARLATEESFTVEGDSTAQAPPVTQRASVDLSFSKTERSFATQQEEKVSASMSEKKDVTVQEDHSIRAPVLMQTATEDKPQLLNDNVGSMKPKAGQPQQLINNVESTKAKVEPSEDKPQQLTNNIESMKPKVEPAEDKPQQLTDNVENTKSIFEDSSASKGLYSTRTTTQGASMADVPLVVEGGSATQASLTRETVVKDTDNQERVFKGDVSKTSDRPVEDMVSSSNVNHKRDDLAESNGHPVEEKASSTTVDLEKVSKDDVAKSNDHPVEDKASSTTFSQEKVSKDVTTSKDQTVEETLPVVQSEDKPQQVTDNVATTKPMTQESIVQSQGSSAIQSSSPPGEQSVTEKEDKNSASSYEKNGSSWKTVTEEPVAPENSPSNEMSGATKMEYKNSTSTYENKDNFGLPQQLSVHNETEDKPQKLTDNVATTKPVAHESIAPPEGSSAIRGSSLPEEPSVIEDHPSATQGAATLEKEEKNLASSYEKKDLSGKTVIEEPATTDISPSNEVSMAMKMEYNNSTSTSENKECNYAKGRWVHDTKRPLYSGSKCKQWLSWMWACRLTTRSDFRFEQYRWQPENCNMPQFDRFSFLERMRNKTIAFMGDSIGRQQFQSLMCMLTGGEDSPEVEDVSHYYGLTTPPGISMKREGAFRFPRTRTTIVYHWSSCLCHLVPLRNNEPNSAIAMHLDRAPYFLRRFLHKLDVLVLNTGHHWNRGKFKSNRWIMYVNGRPNEDRRLFQMANAKNLTIHSLVKWIDSQLASNPNLKVFFRTISPRHFFNGEWNTGGSCENTTPLARGSEVKQEASSDEVTASAVRGTRVKLLDITALSELRDEGHLSKFGYKGDSGVRDCLHWCLPGVPDTWNEILAAQI